MTNTGNRGMSPTACSQSFTCPPGYFLQPESLFLCHFFVLPRCQNPQVPVLSEHVTSKMHKCTNVFSGAISRQTQQIRCGTSDEPLLSSSAIFHIRWCKKQICMTKNACPHCSCGFSLSNERGKIQVAQKRGIEIDSHLSNRIASMWFQGVSRCRNGSLCFALSTGKVWPSCNQMKKEVVANPSAGL